jgi:hypothetical protein
MKQNPSLQYTPKFVKLTAEYLQDKIMYVRFFLSKLYVIYFV